MHCYILFTWVAINVLSLHAENIPSPSTPNALNPYNATFAGINNQTNKDAVAPHNRKRRFLSNMVDFFKKAVVDAKKLTTNMEYEKKILEVARKQGPKKFYNKIVETHGKEKLSDKFEQLRKDIKDDLDALNFDSKEQQVKIKRENERKPKDSSSEKKDPFSKFVESLENAEKAKPRKSSKKPEVSKEVDEIVSKYSSQEIAEIIKRYENEEEEWMESEARSTNKFNLFKEKDLKNMLDTHKQEIKATLDAYTKTMLDKGLTKEKENLIEYKTLKSMENIMESYEKQLLAKMEAQAQIEKMNPKSGKNIDAEYKKNKIALRKTFNEHEKEVHKMFHDYTKKFQKTLRNLAAEASPEEGSHFKINKEEREKIPMGSHEDHFDPHNESEEKFSVEKLAKILKERSQMDSVMEVLNKLKQSAEHTDLSRLKEAVAVAEKAEERLVAAKKALAQQRELRMASSIKKAKRLKEIRDRLFEARKDSMREEVFRIHLTPRPDTAMGDFLGNMKRDIKAADKLKKDVLSRFPDVSSGEVNSALQQLDMLRQKAELRTERLKSLLPDLIPKEDAHQIKEDLELVDKLRNTSLE